MDLLLRFSANHLPLSWAIRARTWSKYSHVDFVIDKEKGLYLGAIPLYGVSIHTSNQSVEDFFKLEVTEEQHNEILERAKREIGKPYDYWGLFGFALHRNWQENDKWFCSEYVAAMIQPTVKLFNEEPQKISPRDLSIHGSLIKL